MVSNTSKINEGYHFYCNGGGGGVDASFAKIKINIIKQWNKTVELNDKSYKLSNSIITNLKKIE